MSRPRSISKWETLSLLGLGLLSTFCLSPLLLRAYIRPNLQISFFAVIAGCLIYPACLLAYTRKAIAQKNGDWKLLLFILAFNYALFYLASLVPSSLK